MSQTYTDPKTGQTHEFPDDATPQEIDAATQPKGGWTAPPRNQAQDTPILSAILGRAGAGGDASDVARSLTQDSMPFLGSIPATAAVKGAWGGLKGAVSRAPEWTGIPAVAAGAKGAWRGLRGPSMPPAQGPTGSANLPWLRPPARPPVQEPTPAGIAQPAPAPREAQFPPFQRAEVGVAQPAPTPPTPQFPPFKPAEVGMAPPRPDAVRPPPAWQQPKAVTITGNTGPTGASAGSSGAGPQPRPEHTSRVLKPSGSQDIELARAHRPAETIMNQPPPVSLPPRPPVVQPEPVIPAGPAVMPGPSGTAGIVAKDSLLQSALEVARQAKNQHNKGFQHGGKVR